MSVDVGELTEVNTAMLNSSARLGVGLAPNNPEHGDSSFDPEDSTGTGGSGSVSDLSESGVEDEVLSKVR